MKVQSGFEHSMQAAGNWEIAAPTIESVWLAAAAAAAAVIVLSYLTCSFCFLFLLLLLLLLFQKTVTDKSTTPPFKKCI